MLGQSLFLYFNFTNAIISSSEYYSIYVFFFVIYFVLSQFYAMSRIKGAGRGFVTSRQERRCPGACWDYRSSGTCTGARSGIYGDGVLPWGPGYPL